MIATKELRIRATPKKTILGLFKILRKSCTLRVKPIENITTLNNGTIKEFKFDQNSGLKKAQSEKRITQKGKRFVDLTT